MSELLGQLVYELCSAIIIHITDNPKYFTLFAEYCEKGIYLFAEYCEKGISELYSYIGQYYHLRIALIYLLFFYFLVGLLKKRSRKAVVVYTSKILDKNSQEAVKKKVAENVKEIKSLVEKLRSFLDQNKSGEFNKRIDKALFELKKIQNLHNEHKVSVMDSHSRIIELLQGKDGQEPGVKENQTKGGKTLDKLENNIEYLEVKAEAKEQFHENKKVGNKNLNELIAMERSEENTEKHTQDKTRKNSENIEKDPQGTESINKSSVELGGQLDIKKEEFKREEIKKEEVKQEDLKKEEAIKPPQPFRPAVFNPRPTPISTTRQPPAPRGKVVPPMPSDRSKYTPPQAIKSNPFG